MGCGATADREIADAGCHPVLARAIEVRGGPLTSFRRIVRAEVYIGFPGTWQFEYAFHLPDFYRWTIHTSDQPDHYSWDGHTMRASVGDTVVGVDSSGAAPLRSHALWNAITNLDFLCTPDANARIIPQRPASATEQRLLVRLADGSEYRLAFDIQSRLIRASGPIEMAPYGSGLIVAEYYEHRRLGKFLVPTRSRYRFAGRDLSEETTTAFDGNDPAIAEQFGISKP